MPVMMYSIACMRIAGVVSVNDRLQSYNYSNIVSPQLHRFPGAK